MKKTEIKGPLKKDLRRQLKTINSKKAMVESLSKSAFEEETKLWKHLRREFPNMSDSCTLRSKKGKLILIDRMPKTDSLTSGTLPKADGNDTSTTS